MRKLVLGLDSDGRSCVVEESKVESTAVDSVPGVAVASLYSTTESPPAAPPAGTGNFVDVNLPPGLVRWHVVEHEPHSPDDEPTAATELHYNNALELIFMLEGSAEVVLGNGSVEIRPGDCVVMPGVDHAMRAGPKGSRVLAIAIGTPRPT